MTNPATKKLRNEVLRSALTEHKRVIKPAIDTVRDLSGKMREALDRLEESLAHGARE